MSFDHRVVDGADADRFLADVKKTLEGFPDDAA
jgi:2-oxoglutarate dehydrogenase E2 component (dihydrolipoamide succinyltransferase)